MSSRLRNTNITRLKEQSFDVCVIGAGINGAVSAAALAGQGLKVALIDKGDFGGFTSSQSSNLAWGGIKYMETGEFGLVWKLCKSRNLLSRSYPSTVKEIRFLTTVEKDFRLPSFFVYLGTLVYWLIGRFATRAPKFFSPQKLKEREPLIETRDAVAGIEYSDCYLHDNDARFVWGFVRKALDYGAAAVNYVCSTGARREGDDWIVAAREELSGLEFDIRARVLVNACGPYVDEHNALTGQETTHRHLFSKGIHLVVDRVMERKRILTFFASDGRLFFILPMGPKTCIGTTDTRVDDPETGVTDEDRDFVLANANELLALTTPLTRADIIAERCGVRPLAVTGHSDSDWISLSRKHAIDVDEAARHISIFGGKLTDCINVGDEVADIVESLGLKRPFAGRKWYGEPDEATREEFMHQAQLMGLDDMTDADSSEVLSERFWRRYGADAFEMLESIRANPDNAKRMLKTAEYLRCEIEHTGRREMITRLEDFLRRRSKISQVVREESLRESPGLLKACRVFFGDDAEMKLDEYWATREPKDQPPAEPGPTL
ncbi:MAG: glycerol-3-phosphate dehydrogenase/oxidase [Woeseiaceae bacterium]|nr:glycerol-3-phosphate dehydrogenase/oxidase [Woeseiaceae bacterium]